MFNVAVYENRATRPNATEIGRSGRGYLHPQRWRDPAVGTQRLNAEPQQRLTAHPVGEHSDAPVRHGSRRPVWIGSGCAAAQRIDAV